MVTTTAGASNEESTDDLLPSKRAFVGADTCRECHAKNHARWSKDWHARALSKPTAATVAGRYTNVHFAGASSEAWMKRSGSRYVMRTFDREHNLGDYPVSWVIGGKRMQDAVTQLPDGRWQVLPVYYHVTGKGEWVDYNESKQGVVSPDHPFFWTNFRRTANHECLDCHATGVDVRYERARRRWTTEFVDAGVGCESCHGPGARHAETKEKSDIIQPAKVSKEAGLAICGSCHGPRNPLFPILDARHRFQPGDRYDEKYQALVIVDGRSRSGEYFADGRPSSSSFEYQALLQSKCYMKGQATCLDCHTAPHKPHGANELAPLKKGVVAGKIADVDAGCVGCHAPVFAAGKAHTRHQAAQAQSCVACHMPKIVTGVLDKFADHSIDVPVPLNAARHDVPSACGTCHAKDPPQKQAEGLARLWPDSAKRQARRILLADAIDEKTAASSLPALKAVVADRSEAPILRGAAAVLLGQRFPRDAAAVLPGLLSDSSPVVRTRALEGLGYAGAKQSVEAVRVLSRDPELQVRQMAALVLSMFEASGTEAVLAGLARDPKSEGLVQPHMMLGLLKLRAGKVEEARREIERVVELMPYNANALVLLADMHGRAGQLEEAHALLEDALTFDPQNQGAHKRLNAMLGAPEE